MQTVKPIQGTAKIAPKLQLALVTIVFFGVVLRLFNLRHPELWADEIFSVALAQSPFVDMVLAALRFDVHPPLYYVVLHVWGAFGTGDFWFLASSLLLDVAAGMSLWWCMRQLHGDRAGLIALAVFAVFPLEVSFAATLRMYSLSVLILVWLWYHLERANDGTSTRKRYAWMSSLGVLATLSHGIGFILVFFLFAQAATGAFRKQQKRALLALVLAYLPVALAAAYPLVVGSVREAGVGLKVFSLSAIDQHLHIFLLGYSFPFIPAFGYLALGFLVALAMTSPRALSAFLRLVALPMVGLLLLSIFVKPVFLFRTLGLLSPFLMVTVALAVDDVLNRGGWRAQCVSAMLLLLSVPSAVTYSLTDNKLGYREVAAAWVAHAGSKAVLFTETPTDFWGMLRYDEAGPAPSALAIQPPVKDAMKSLKRKLEGSVLDGLGFFGTSDYAARNGRRVYVHTGVEIHASDLGSEIWILSRGNTTSCESIRLKEVRRFTEFDLALMQCGNASALLR